MESATVVLRPITTRRQRLKSVLHQTVLDGRYYQTQLLLSMDSATHPPADVGAEGAQFGGVITKVNATDLNGRTPLMVALLLDDRKLAEKFVLLMLEHGANTYVEDRFGQTPLHYACSFGLHRIIDILTCHESFVPRNILHADMDGNTPLHILVEANDLGYLGKLLQVSRSREFDVDAINVIGLTPLLLAVRLGHFRAAYQLLRAGADPSIRDAEMKLNALDWILREDLKKESQIPLAPITGRRFQLIWKKTIRLKSQYDRPTTPVCKHRSRFDNESIMNSDRQAAVMTIHEDDANYKEQVIELVDQFFGRCPVSLGSKQRTLVSIASACEFQGSQQQPSTAQGPSSFRTPSGWPKTAKLRKLLNRPEQSLPLWTLLDLYTTKTSPFFRSTVKPEMHEFELLHQSRVNNALATSKRNNAGASSSMSMIHSHHLQSHTHASTSALAGAMHPPLQPSQSGDRTIRRTNSVSDHNPGGRGSTRYSVIGNPTARLGEHARNVGRMLSVVSSISNISNPSASITSSTQQHSFRGGASRLGSISQQ